MSVTKDQIKRKSPDVPLTAVGRPAVADRSALLAAADRLAVVPAVVGRRAVVR